MSLFPWYPWARIGPFSFCRHRSRGGHFVYSMRKVTTGPLNLRHGAPSFGSKRSVFLSESCRESSFQKRRGVDIFVSDMGLSYMGASSVWYALGGHSGTRCRRMKKNEAGYSRYGLLGSSDSLVNKRSPSCDKFGKTHVRLYSIAGHSYAMERWAICDGSCTGVLLERVHRVKARSTGSLYPGTGQHRTSVTAGSPPRRETDGERTCDVCWR